MHKARYFFSNLKVNKVLYYQLEFRNCFCEQQQRSHLSSCHSGFASDIFQGKNSATLSLPHCLQSLWIASACSNCAVVCCTLHEFTVEQERNRQVLLHCTILRKKSLKSVIVTFLKHKIDEKSTSTFFPAITMNGLFMGQSAGITTASRFVVITH